jgi:hypothetical protein
MTEVTRILSALDQGDPSAAEQLLPLVYDELRRLAAARLAHERAGRPRSESARTPAPLPSHDFSLIFLTGVRRISKLLTTPRSFWFFFISTRSDTLVAASCPR